jgi:hypothetical protein
MLVAFVVVKEVLYHGKWYAVGVGSESVKSHQFGSQRVETDGET